MQLRNSIANYSTDQAIWREQQALMVAATVRGLHQHTCERNCEGASSASIASATFCSLFTWSVHRQRVVVAPRAGGLVLRGCCGTRLHQCTKARQLTQAELPVPFLQMQRSAPATVCLLAPDSLLNTNTQTKTVQQANVSTLFLSIVEVTTRQRTRSTAQLAPAPASAARSPTTHTPFVVQHLPQCKHSTRFRVKVLRLPVQQVAQVATRHYTICRNASTQRSFESISAPSER
jgi:hypothetical protein